jgi:hypothetical protein
MRQSSEKFMDALLEENKPPAENNIPDLSQQIAEAIDRKMEQAMAKYNEEIAKINLPTKEVETPNNNDKEDLENGNTEEGAEGSDGECDS